MLFNLISPTIIGCLIAFAVGALIVLTKSLHGRWTLDETTGVQKFHSHAATRIGGLAVVAGTFVSGFISPSEVKDLMLPLLVSSLIPFFFGLIEDVTKQVSVRVRLLATMMGAIVAILFTGTYLDHLDVPGFDWFMTWWPIGSLVTVVAVSGITNAINIIDGFNGLASGTAIVIVTFLGLIAYQSNDFLLMQICMILAGSVLGFMFLNYPFGKIFLGDAGAYFIGFMVAWIAILLPMRNDAVSPWASLLASSYPVIEVVYSIFRRLNARQKAGQPDCLHLHTLIKTRIVKHYFMFLPNWARNSLVAPVIWLCSIVLGLISASYFTDILMLVAIFAAFVLLYHVTYRFLRDSPV